MAAAIVLAMLLAAMAALGTATAPPAHAADGTISHVASASTAANQASHTVQIPNSVQSGDSLLLFMTTNSTSTTVTTPSGWTVVESRDGDGVRGRVWTRTATTGIIGTNVTVTLSAATKAVLSLSAYRSTIGSPTISASASNVVNSSASNHTTPSVNVAGANSWLVNYWGEKSSTDLTWTLPNNATSRTTWLNQIELYFSIVQRKALSPNSFDSLDELADRLLRFGEHYRQIARPFDWTFTRADLERVLAKITEREPRRALAA